MSDIVINGVSITELNKQRLAIKEDASKLMAERIETVKTLVSTILEAETLTVAEEAATEAERLLREVSEIHTASGVEYYLPYSSEYSSDGYASDIDDKMGEFDITWRSKSILVDFQQTLEDMEYVVCGWNTSKC